MDEYLIGAGAVLTAGPEASISAATLHAQTELQLAQQVRAALIDFEAASPGEIARVVILATGWTGAQFEAEVIRPLLALGECVLADVIAKLADATGTEEVHLFAHWLPDDVTTARLSDRGVSLLVHPLGAIGQAALISGQRFRRWRAPFRAA